LVHIGTDKDFNSLASNYKYGLGWNNRNISRSFNCPLFVIFRRKVDVEKDFQINKEKMGEESGINYRHSPSALYKGRGGKALVSSALTTTTPGQSKKG